jgi:hypothetical protein
VSEPAEKLAEVIPAFYYDLISRVVPGGAVLFLYFLLRLEGSELAAKAITSGYTLLLGLGASYLIGLMLTPLGYLVGSPNWRLVAKTRKLPVMSPATLWEQIDRLERDKQEAQAAVLSKMAAEATLTESLTAGVILLFALALLTSTPSPLSQIALLLLTALCLLNAYFRKAVLVGRAHGIEQAHKTARQ